MAQVDLRYYRYRNREDRNNHKNWSVEEDTRLLEMRAEGKGPAFIAKELGRSESGVEYRLKILKPPKPGKGSGIRCQKCGASCEREDDFVFCPECGEETKESRKVAIDG